MPCFMYTVQPAADVVTDWDDMREYSVDAVYNYSEQNVGALDVYHVAGKGIRAFHQLQKWIIGESVLTQAMIDGITAEVNAIKDHPALYAYSLMDEPTINPGHPNEVPVGSLKTIADLVVSLDPDHPLYVVYPGYGAFFWPTDIAYPLEPIYTDLFAIDNYPVDNNGNFSSSFESQIQAAYNATPVGLQSGLMFTMQTFRESLGYDLLNSSQIQQIYNTSASVGWNTAGMSFFIYSNGGVSWRGLKESIDIQPICKRLGLLESDSPVDNYIFTDIGGEVSYVYKAYAGKTFSQDGINYYNGVEDGDAVSVTAIGLTAY